MKVMSVSVDVVVGVMGYKYCEMFGLNRNSVRGVSLVSADD